MPSSPGRTTSFPLTNGYPSPVAAEATGIHSRSAHSESDHSATERPAAVGASSDEDGLAEDQDGDVDMASDTESSSEEDADGETDGDYESDSAPPVEVDGRRSRSSSSASSTRPPKRKVSVTDDEHITQNPELYGLRRSVRGHGSRPNLETNTCQGRARPTRRIVSGPSVMPCDRTDPVQMDSDDSDESDPPCKRQRTASRKSKPSQRLISTSAHR